MKKVATFILFLIILGSCEKEEGWTSVSGTVIDDIGNFVPNKKIIIGSQCVTFSWDMCATDSIFETYTDNEGKYELYFYAKKDFYYIVVSVIDSCYFERQYDIRNARDNIVDIEIPRKGVLKIGYESTYGNTPLYYALYGEYGGYILSSNILMSRTEVGQPRYLFTEYASISVFTILKYEINNIDKIISDTVWLKPSHCDTLTYIIKNLQK
jgi:hypothetical protein